MIRQEITAETIAAGVFVVDSHNRIPGGTVTTKHCFEYPRLVRIEHNDFTTGACSVSYCVDGRRTTSPREALAWLNAPAPATEAT